MIKFTELPSYQKDLKKYKQVLEQINNSKVYSKVLNLIKELESEAALIDKAHNSYNNGRINLRILKDNIDKVMDIRIELEKICQGVKEH